MDRKKLALSKHELFMLKNPFDLQKLENHGGNYFSRFSFANLFERCLGIKGIKQKREINSSNWDSDFLGEHQILQASL